MRPVSLSSRGHARHATSWRWQDGGRHWVEWGSGAAALGRACLFPPLSRGGPKFASPFLPAHPVAGHERQHAFRPPAGLRPCINSDAGTEISNPAPSTGESCANLTFAVFGEDDHFFNRFATMIRSSPVLPLIGGGATRFPPLFVDDMIAGL
jgi:hypothetical protein